MTRISLYHPDTGLLPGLLMKPSRLQTKQGGSVTTFPPFAYHIHPRLHPEPLLSYFRLSSDDSPIYSWFVHHVTLPPLSHFFSLADVAPLSRILDSSMLTFVSPLSCTIPRLIPVVADLSQAFPVFNHS